MQVDLKCFAKLVSTVRVGNDFYEATKHTIITSTIANTFVGHYVKVEVTLSKDCLEEFDHLESENILTQVIIDLEDARNDSSWCRHIRALEPFRAALRGTFLVLCSNLLGRL